jgi:hypothetical protein
MDHIAVDNTHISRSSPHVVLRRASNSPPWSEDDYDVLADGARVGRLTYAHAAPQGSHWFWTLCYGYREDRAPTQGYAATREQAMAAFSKSWRRE